MYGATLLALVFSIQTLIGGVLSIISGVLSDTYGRKPMILLGSSMGLLGVLFFFLYLTLSSPIVGILFIIGIIIYFSAGSVSGAASNALLTESISENYLGRASSFLSISFIGSIVLGSIFFPFLTQWYGLLFSLVLSLILVTLFFFSRLFLIETLRKKVKEGSIREFFLNSMKSIKYTFTKKEVSFLSLYVVVGGLFTGISVFLPSYLKDVMHLRDEIIGLYFSLSAIISTIAQPLGGWFVDKFGGKLGMIIDGLVEGTILIIFAFLSIFMPFLALTVLLINSAFDPFYSSGYIVFIKNYTNEEERGKVFGGMTSLRLFPSSLSPILVGIIWNINPLLIFLVAGVAMFPRVYLLFLIKGGEI